MTIPRPLHVVFARHGESTANVDGIFANRTGIPNDLTPTGIAQAHDLARMLDTLDITHVYTSPLSRAAQTAAIVSTRLGVPVATADALREYDVGDDEGLPYTGDHAWRWDRYLAVDEAWRDGMRDARHPGGESLADLEARFLRFMEELSTRHRPADTVLAISHGGLLRVVLPALCADVSRQLTRNHGLWHGDLVIITLEAGSWRCRSWAGIDPEHANP